MQDICPKCEGTGQVKLLWFTVACSQCKGEREESEVSTSVSSEHTNDAGADGATVGFWASLFGGMSHSDSDGKGSHGHSSYDSDGNDGGGGDSGGDGGGGD